MTDVSNCKTEHHTWYNMRAHLMRPNRGVIRCVIKQFELLPYTSLRVTFTENGVRWQKRVSPLQIIAVHIFWLQNEIVSDDDDSSIEPTSSVLPALRHTKKITMNKGTIGVYNYIVKEIDMFQQLLNSVCDVNG